MLKFRIKRGGSKRVYHSVTFGDLNIGILKYSLEKVTTKMTTV